MKIGDYVRLSSDAQGNESLDEEASRRSPGIVVGSTYSPDRYHTIKVQWLEIDWPECEETWPIEMLEVIDDTDGEHREVLAGDLHD